LLTDPLRANYVPAPCDAGFSKENEVLEFPGFGSDTPFATDPTTAYFIIKEQMRAEPSDVNSEASRRESSKASRMKLSYKQKLFIRGAEHASRNLIEKRNSGSGI
jgi:hypothetical protein